MTRRKYFDLCMGQPLEWLKACASNPSEGMNQRHVMLCLLAIRKKSHGMKEGK